MPSPESISQVQARLVRRTDDYVYKPTKGLNEDIVREISHRRASRTYASSG